MDTATERNGDRVIALYDAEYYQNYSPRKYERDDYWLRVFREIADRIVVQIGPKSVLDAGCALGILVETLRERGVEAEGIDLSAYAIAHVHEPMRPFCRVASVTDDLPGHYDLVICLEVLEHLPPEDAARAIDNFCQHSDDVLFSSTPIHYRDTTHLNVRPAEYWAERFAEHGFYRDIDFDAAFICPWAVRFRRRRDPFSRVVAEYERGFGRLSFERNELRTMAEDIRLQLTAAQARISELEAEQARLKQGQAEATARLAALGAELAVARATVENMQRSAFWRARGLWVAMRRFLGGRS